MTSNTIGWMRGRWTTVITAAAAVFAALSVGLSAAPASASTVQVGTLQTCSTPTTVPQPFAGASVPTLGTDKAAWSNLLNEVRGLNLPNPPVMFYGGATITEAQLGTWVGLVQSHCLAGGVNIGAFYQTARKTGGDAGARKAIVGLVNYLNQFNEVQRYLVFTHDIGNGSTATVNALVKAMKAKICNGAQVIVVGDMANWKSASDSATALKLYQGDVRSDGYFPFIGSPPTAQHYYGPMSATTTAAKADAQATPANATGVVQAYSYWDSDPTSAAYFQFSHRTISPSDVLGMSGAELKAGVHSIVVYFLEPFADCTCAVTQVVAGVSAQVAQAG